MTERDQELDNGQEELDIGVEFSHETESSESGEEQERPEYGGESGRPFREEEVVGTKEYVDGSRGVQRIYHEEDGPFEGEETESGEQDEHVNSEQGYARKVSHHTDFHFEDAEGEPISSRLEEGTIYLRFLPVDAIIFPGEEGSQIRKGSLNTFNLETSIDQLGLLEPIHVVPFGQPIAYEKDEDDNDIIELPIYARYTLLHGRRRLEASINLGYDEILALVDTTVPFPLIEVYQAFSHQSDAYSFSESMAYAKLVRQQQPMITSELLENALGYKTGELPKADYIEQMKIDFPDIYNKVETGKFTIDQGFKAIEKEQTRMEKESEKGEGEDEEKSDSDSKDDLEELEIEKRQQELGDRQILPAPIRRAVESRDEATCQGCGYGEGIPDLANMFSVHHMVPVQFGGSDGVDNLILLCQNCHKMAHDYELGRLPISTDTYDRHDFVKKVVVLGNMMKKTRQLGMKKVKEGDAALGRRLDKGSISVGRALQQGKIKINAEDVLFNGSPYQVFKETTRNVRFRGVQGELGEIEDSVNEEESSVTDNEIESVLDVGLDDLADDGIDLESVEDITLEDMMLDVQIAEEDGLDFMQPEIPEGFTVEILPTVGPDDFEV